MRSAGPPVTYAERAGGAAAILCRERGGRRRWCLHTARALEPTESPAVPAADAQRVSDPLTTSSSFVSHQRGEVAQSEASEAQPPLAGPSPRTPSPSPSPRPAFRCLSPTPPGAMRGFGDRGRDRDRGG